MLAPPGSGASSSPAHSLEGRSDPSAVAARGFPLSAWPIPWRKSRGDSRAPRIVGDGPRIQLLAVGIADRDAVGRPLRDPGGTQALSVDVVVPAPRVLPDYDHPTKSVTDDLIHGLPSRSRA